PHPHFTRGRKESSTIFMGRRIFEGNAHEIEEDVIATVYHESRHAVQSGEGLPLDYLLGDVKDALYSGQIRLDSFENVGELDSYHFIFRKWLEGKLKVSETYFEFIKKNYTHYFELLQQRRGETTSALEMRFIEAALDQVKDLPVSLLNYDQVK
ncbi:hypothetical protein HYY69_03540, partial [Candidatus Woesearchaeota archaeon]|nr:hypothetical protein [Candidatus Woesearchaeota archaeon]